MTSSGTRYGLAGFAAEVTEHGIAEEGVGAGHSAGSKWGVASGEEKRRRAQRSFAGLRIKLRPYKGNADDTANLQRRARYIVPLPKEKRQRSCRAQRRV